GAGHSAVIHSRTPANILAYGAALGVLRVSVNASGSTGSAGLDTHLPPTMTIGTGFFGGSSLTENLQPRDLVQWTQVAYSADPAEPFGEFSGLEPWTASASPVAAVGPGAVAPAAVAPAAVAPAAVAPAAAVHASAPAPAGFSREELRRLIVEELRDAVRS
ncbi:MAG TPA: hypothetical protein VG186_19140, partial [Solirubrobacteraceae bacterium]|nr:hypothetical protein [Solirubrobacteraceae bacterium]